jgi:hypothetical protein
VSGFFLVERVLIGLTEEGKSKIKTTPAPKKTTITTDNTRLIFFLFLLDNFCMV